jgi:AraC-like DNA-binding protein/quercetin dioxygenase-like cupin family protein
MRPKYESILPLETNSFKAFIQVKKEFDFPFHYHPEYELTYILSSSGVRYVGNRFENFSENDLVMLGPNLPHCWKNIDSPQVEAVALVIQWNADLLGSKWLDKKEFTSVKKLHQRSEKGIRFLADEALQLKDRLVAIIKAPAFEKIIELVRILHQLSHSENCRTLCEESFSNNMKYGDNERLNTIYHYMKTHYRDKITLKDVASRVCMTEVSFSRFFSKLMNKTFVSFLNEYRINIACTLLIETDLQLTQICYDAGYDSIPFFYRQFKRFKNCTPLFYRHQFKSTGDFSIPLPQ